MGKLTALIDKCSEQFVYIAATILEAAATKRFVACTGDITVAETLVKPYQTGNIQLVTDFKAFFATDDFISVLSHDADTFDLAAQIRAKHRMKFADALHYATALKAGCVFFITNDAGIRSNEALDVILIKDLLE